MKSQVLVALSVLLAAPVIAHPLGRGFGGFGGFGGNGQGNGLQQFNPTPVGLPNPNSFLGGPSAPAQDQDLGEENLPEVEDITEEDVEEISKELEKAEQDPDDIDIHYIRIAEKGADGSPEGTETIIINGRKNTYSLTGSGRTTLKQEIPDEELLVYLLTGQEIVNEALAEFAGIEEGDDDEDDEPSAEDLAALENLTPEQ